MGKSKGQLVVIFLAMFVFMLAASYGSVNAMQFKAGEDTTIDCDVNIAYGAGWRVSDRDDDRRYPAADVSVDDANENFDQWSMINNKLTLIADIEIQHKNFGLFVRPKVLYDHVYMSDNDNDSPATNNALAGGLIDDADEWPDEVEDIHGFDAEILDLFAYASFQLGGRDVDLRVGKQVIAWGESFLISGGISSAMSPVDVSAAVAVGVELKEIYMPTESVYVQMALTDSLGLMGYYQWAWEKSKLMEGGTFFSAADFLDEIKAPMMMAPSGLGLPTIDRADDDEADDSGQFGVGLTWVMPWYESTEIGLYYINYHDKNPTVNVSNFYEIPGIGIVPGNYYLSYTEDIKLYGVSVSSIVGDVNVSGEYSYRQDVLENEGDYWQAQVSILHSMNFPLCDTLSLVGEVACGRTVDLDDDEFAWKYVIKPTLKWYSVFPDFDLELPLAYEDTNSGTNPLGTEGVSAASIGVAFTYKYKYKGSLTYTDRMGSANYAEDRDTLALKLSYAF